MTYQLSLLKVHLLYLLLISLIPLFHLKAADLKNSMINCLDLQSSQTPKKNTFTKNKLTNFDELNGQVIFHDSKLSPPYLIQSQDDLFVEIQLKDQLEISFAKIKEAKWNSQHNDYDFVFTFVNQAGEKDSRIIRGDNILQIYQSNLTQSFFNPSLNLSSNKINIKNSKEDLEELENTLSQYFEELKKSTSKDEKLLLAQLIQNELDNFSIRTTKIFNRDEELSYLQITNCSNIYEHPICQFFQKQQRYDPPHRVFIALNSPEIGQSYFSPSANEFIFSPKDLTREVISHEATHQSVFFDKIKNAHSFILYPNKENSFVKKHGYDEYFFSDEVRAFFTSFVVLRSEMINDFLKKNKKTTLKNRLESFKELERKISSIKEKKAVEDFIANVEFLSEQIKECLLKKFCNLEFNEEDNSIVIKGKFGKVEFYNQNISLQSYLNIKKPTNMSEILSSPQKNNQTFLIWLKKQLESSSKRKELSLCLSKKNCIIEFENDFVKIKTLAPDSSEHIFSTSSFIQQNQKEIILDILEKNLNDTLLIKERLQRLNELESLKKRFLKNE